MYGSQDEVIEGPFPEYREPIRRVDALCCSGPCGRARGVVDEICQTAKTQGWATDEFLRTLIEAEIAARDESNLRGRIKAGRLSGGQKLGEL